jgi:hypothetical protein
MIFGFASDFAFMTAKNSLVASGGAPFAADVGAAGAGVAGVGGPAEDAMEQPSREATMTLAASAVES